MDVQELKERKRELEAIILKLINQFEEDTGIRISYVNLHNFRLTGDSKPVTYGVRLDTEIW